jgi:hypothetical protein
VKYGVGMARTGREGRDKMSGINTKPKDQTELHSTLEALRVTLEEMKANPADPSQHETFLKAAADIEAAKVHLAKVEKDTTLALELARDAAASGPSRKVDARALKHLPKIYTLSAGSDLHAMFGGRVSQFNLLNYTKQDLAGVDAEVVTRVERFRYVNSQLVAMHALMMAQGSVQRENYLRAGGMESLPFWGEFVELSREFSAAMDTQESGAGSQWVPTGVNLTLIQDVRPEHMTRAMFQTYNMTRSPQLFPVQGAAFRAFLLSEATDVHRSATAIGQRRSATANVTFTAKKFGALTDYSRELLQDSIVAMGTALRVDHAYAHGETDESIIWNAQLGTNGMGGSPATSSSFDSGVTFGASAQNVDDRAAWDGIRLLYSNGACTTPGDAGSGLIADLFTDQFGQMGRFGVDPSRRFIGTSFLGFAKALVMKDSAGHNVTLTAEKAGGAGTFQTGVLAMVFGSALIPSTQYPQTLNSAGAVDGSGTRTAFHIVAKDRFGMGEVQTLEIAASDQVAFDTDQIVVRSIARKHWQPYVTPSSTETSIGAILNA